MAVVPPDAGWGLTHSVQKFQEWVRTDPPPTHLGPVRQWLYEVELMGPPASREVLRDEGDSTTCRSTVDETPVTIVYLVLAFERLVIVQSISS